jgi:hypothetical protein
MSSNSAFFEAWTNRCDSRVDRMLGQVLLELALHCTSSTNTQSDQRQSPIDLFCETIQLQRHIIIHSSLQSSVHQIRAIGHKIRLEALSHQVTIPRPEHSVMPVYESACSDSITGVAGLSEMF